jgi:hypothetical protein
MFHRQKGTRVSHAHSSARKPLLRRSSVAGLAHSDPFQGSGARSSGGVVGGGGTALLRILGLALLLAAAIVAVAAAPAQAAKTRNLIATFASPGPAAGQLENPQGLAINQETGDLYVADQGVLA